MTLLFCLAALEIGVRFMKLEEPRPMQTEPKENWALVPERIWTEHHPVLGWFHEKKKEAIHRHTAYEVYIVTNSQGFRGPREYAKEKPAGVLRVLALGDSFTFGFGVENDETFPVVLEKKHENLEVINLGVAAYGVDQMLLAFREIGRHYDPDYTFVNIFPEDFWRALRAFADTGHAKPYFVLDEAGDLELQNVPVPPPFTLRTNQFPEVIRYGAAEQVLMKSAVYRLTKRMITRLGKNLGWIHPDTTTEWILGRVILQQLIAEIRGSNSHPVLVLVPPDRWMENNDMVSLRKSIIRFAEETGVDFIDLTPVLHEAVKAGKLSDYYISGDGHWTAPGHQVVAATLEAYLQEQGALPSAENETENAA